MMKKWLYVVAALLLWTKTAYAVDPGELLPPEQAFVPTLTVEGEGAAVRFRIADGYYLYQSKIAAQSDAADLLGEPRFAAGKEKEDEFFGKQQVYYGDAAVNWAYRTAAPQQYRITVSYQGCADVGVCYPPVETSFDVAGGGVYETAAAAEAENRFVKKPVSAPDATAAKAVAGGLCAPADASAGALNLSWDTLWANLLVFLLAGLGLSFTACMYPLLSIVSGIVVGDKSGSKRRAFALSAVYVQGLALTYTLVGVLAGLTGALLTVWLQQAWVVLSASVLMLLLALSMFGVFNLQLPGALQSYFQTKSSGLSGGKIASVFVMGMLSALIVGPCVAPPLAFALGYIGQTGDAVLGGLALYALALGTGIPLMLVATFGGHILPRAGAWMGAVKYVFGLLLLGVSVYLAAPFLGFGTASALYAALLLLPAVLLLWHWRTLAVRVKPLAALLLALSLAGGSWFAYQSARAETTALHEMLLLYPQQDAHHVRRFSDVGELKAAMDKALRDNPAQPVLLDFYADWCVSCREMEAKTFARADVQAAVPMERVFQADVSANTPEQQALLKEYGLYGPPGLFALHADGKRSEPLLGFVKPRDFIAWYACVAEK